MDLTVLNQSGIQGTNQALYQTIKDVIDAINLIQTSFNSTLNLPGGQIKFPQPPNLSRDISTFSDFKKGYLTPLELSGTVLTLTTPASFIKIDNLVVFGFSLTYPVVANAASAQISLPIPYLCGPSPGAVSIAFQNAGLPDVTGYVRENSSHFELLSNSGATTVTQWSGASLAGAGFFITKV